MTTQKRLAEIKGYQSWTRQDFLELLQIAEEANTLAGHKHDTANIFMEQARRLGNERHEALKLLGYDETENDLLANIKRLKAYYEKELACHTAIAIGLKELLRSARLSPSPEASHGTHEAKP